MDYEALIEEVTRRVLERLQKPEKWRWERKVLTEQAVSEAARCGVLVICLEKGQLVTELAKDLARTKGIRIERPINRRIERPGEDG